MSFRGAPSRNNDNPAGSCKEPPRSKPGEGNRSIFGKYFIEPFRGAKNPPWFDARGVAVGLFIGLGLPIGTQTVVLGLLRLLFRFNTIIAFACTCINNPLSIIPMYYGYYCLGSFMLEEHAVVSAGHFRNIMGPVLHADHFWQSLEAFVYLGWDILIRWFLAALIVASTCALIGYVVSFRVWEARCRRKAKQLGLTYEKLLAKLEEPMEKKGEAQD
ncbi:MAG: DUF2062 domain-containing protein [Desulfomonilaceae bacterium]